MTLSPRSITWIRRLLLGAAVLVTLLAAALVEEDWRGNREWRRTETRYAARNEPLRLDAFIGPAIPDRENLFRAPIWSDLISDRIPLARQARAWSAAGLDKLGSVRAVSVWVPDLAVTRGQMIRAGLLPKDDAQPPAQAVLAGLKPVAPLCDCLHAAVRERPLGGDEANPPFAFGHVRLGEVYRITQVLIFRARVELAAGKMDDAYSDTYTALRIARATQVHPATVLDAFIVMAMVETEPDTIKAAFAKHGWSEAQVADLQNALTDIRPQTYLGTALRSERAAIIAAIDAFPTLTSEQRKEMGLPRWLPAGWLQENKVAVCDAVDRGVAVTEALGTMEFTPRLRDMEKYYSHTSPHRWPAYYMPAKFAPMLSGNLRGYGYAVNVLNEMVLAMALERYYLTAGNYPHTLAALVPKYLAAIPQVSTGEEFAYKSTSNGTGFELHETPDKDSKPRVWIQPSAPAVATAAQAPAMAELQRRR